MRASLKEFGQGFKKVQSILDAVRSECAKTNSMCRCADLVPELQNQVGLLNDELDTTRCRLAQVEGMKAAGDAEVAMLTARLKDERSTNKQPCQCLPFIAIILGDVRKGGFRVRGRSGWTGMLPWGIGIMGFASGICKRKEKKRNLSSTQRGRHLRR